MTVSVSPNPNPKAPYSAIFEVTTGGRFSGGALAGTGSSRLRKRRVEAGGPGPERPEAPAPFEREAGEPPRARAERRGEDPRDPRSAARRGRGGGVLPRKRGHEPSERGDHLPLVRDDAGGREHPVRQAQPLHLRLEGVPLGRGHRALPAQVVPLVLEGPDEARGRAGAPLGVARL